MELCGDRTRWKAVTRRPDPPLRGTTGLMMVMMMLIMVIMMMVIMMMMKLIT